MLLLSLVKKVAKETFKQDYIRALHGYNLGKLTYPLSPPPAAGGIRDNSKVFWRHLFYKKGVKCVHFVKTPLENSTYYYRR